MKRAGYIIWLIIVLLFLYMPILMLTVYSFTDSESMGVIRAFSIENYKTLFTTPELRNMISGTFVLAVVSAVISVILGTSGAIGAFYSKKGAKTFIDSANQIPVVNADVVTGFSICILLIVVLNMKKETFIPLIIGHVVLSVPFVYMSVIPRLKQMDDALYEAALDMGAKPSAALRKVIIPQIAPGIFSGFVMAITLSLDDYFITTYTKPATFDTISTYVVNATKGAQTQIKTALWALSAVIFILITLAFIFMNMEPGKEKKNV